MKTQQTDNIQELDDYMCYYYWMHIFVGDAEQKFPHLKGVSSYIRDRAYRHAKANNIDL